MTEDERALESVRQRVYEPEPAEVSWQVLDHDGNIVQSGHGPVVDGHLVLGDRVLGNTKPPRNTVRTVKMQASEKRGMTLDDVAAFVAEARNADVPGSAFVTGDWYAMRRMIKHLEVSG